MNAEKPYKKFLCDYHHDGSDWSLTIMAPDWADAQARVAKLGNLRLRGEVAMEVPAGMPAAGPFVKGLVALRNWLRSLIQ